MARRKTLPLLMALVLAFKIGRANNQLGKKERFPVSRPLVNIHETALQLLGRDGPRYPDAQFLDAISGSRVTITSGANPSQADPSSCAQGYAVLTLANDVAMDLLVPLLLESLQRIALTGNRSGDDLARHTTVVAVTAAADEACRRLAARYRHTCISDPHSGLHDGDNRFPDFRALAFGMTKLRYIVNALTTNTAILYVDADVVFLRNPFPKLLALAGDIAVATAPAPCGSQPTPWMPEEEEEADEDRPQARQAAAVAAASTMADPLTSSNSASRSLTAHPSGDAAQEAADPDADMTARYSTGITFFRSTPGVLRCVYSLLLDMAHLARLDPNGTVVEQDRFAAFMPMCAGALGMRLHALPAQLYVTDCGGPGRGTGAGVGAEAGLRGAVAVHAAGGPGSSLRDRVPLMREVLG